MVLHLRFIRDLRFVKSETTCTQFHIPSERMGCMIPSGWLITELLIYLGPRVSVACTEAAFTAQFKDLPWIRKRAECLPQMAYLRVLRRQFCSSSGVPKVALGSRDFLPGLRGGVFCHTPEWLAQRRTLLLIWWSKMCNDIKPITLSENRPTCSKVPMNSWTRKFGRSCSEAIGNHGNVTQACKGMRFYLRKVGANRNPCFL